MNGQNELYHHGILGMKWGIRRFQNKDGSLTTAGKKRYYKATTTDEIQFGKRGAQRIADRRNNGMDRATAVRREFGRKAIEGLALTTIGTTATYLLNSGKYQDVADIGKRVVDSYFNETILDAGGNVISRYHTTVKYGEDAVNALMRVGKGLG